MNFLDAHSPEKSKNGVQVDRLGVSAEQFHIPSTAVLNRKSALLSPKMSLFRSAQLPLTPAISAPDFRIQGPFVYRARTAARFPQLPRAVLEGVRLPAVPGTSALRGTYRTEATSRSCRRAPCTRKSTPIRGGINSSCYIHVQL